MLDIAYELIGEATSNSLLMFCFCNLIIVIILTGSSKPADSMYSQDYTVTTSVSFNMCNLASHDQDCGGDHDEEEEMNVVDISSAQDESLTDVSSSSEEYEDKESSHSCDDDDDDHHHGDEEEIEDDDDDESNEDEAEEEEEDDDLRKRAEEFIAKVNNEWRHEKRRALNLVY